MPPKPNVMLICVDHWPARLLGCRGHERIMTPTLDSLARSGTLFTQAYSTTPTCIPARRALMTGTRSRTHGDRTFRELEPMDPLLPTMPQTFRDGGYQAFAVGKLHVYPQRDRIGFEEVILNEEGRHHLDGGPDDYELFLRDQGFAGQELTHAMGNNEYTVRPWHLPERTHPTYWTTREMCRAIQRRNPRKPAFWYCSYTAPHPPITPPRDYLEMYRHSGVDEPVIGDWARDPDALPHALRVRNSRFPPMSEIQARAARQGFYAQCTYIDHQIRLLIGTLREEKLLNDTIIVFTGDHGDMLGQHGLWSKPPMFDGSAAIPMIVSPAISGGQPAGPRRDGRLVCLRDVMPTLLEMCGLKIPPTVEGRSMFGGRPRERLFCEHYDNAMAMRMLRTPTHKLIWYPAGNRFQLFDMVEDPCECRDLSGDPAAAAILRAMRAQLAGDLWGSDLEKWVRNGELTGAPEPEFEPEISRGLNNQRGWR